MSFQHPTAETIQKALGDVTEVSFFSFHMENKNGDKNPMNISFLVTR